MLRGPVAKASAAAQICSAGTPVSRAARSSSRLELQLERGLRHLLKSLRPLRDERRRHPVRGHGPVEHGQVEQGIGAGARPEPERGALGDLGVPRVHHDHPGPALLGLEDPGAEDRVALRRVHAGNEDDIGQLEVVVAARGGGGAELATQRGHRARVTEPGAVVHVARAERPPHQAHQGVGLLVAALGGAQRAQAVGAAAGAEAAQLLRHEVEGLVPCGLAERCAPLGFREVVRVRLAPGRTMPPPLTIPVPGPFTAEERGGEPVAVPEEARAGLALDAQLAGAPGGRKHLGHTTRGALQHHRAADTAMGADGRETLRGEHGGPRTEVPQIQAVWVRRSIPVIP